MSTKWTFLRVVCASAANAQEKERAASPHGRSRPFLYLQNITVCLAATNERRRRKARAMPESRPCCRQRYRQAVPSCRRKIEEHTAEYHAAAVLSIRGGMQKSGCVLNAPPAAAWVDSCSLPAASYSAHLLPISADRGRCCEVLAAARLGACPA